MIPPFPSTSGQQSWSDERLDGIIGGLLRVGVILAAAMVLAGGVLYLVQHGQSQAPDYRAFHGDPDKVALPRVLGEAERFHGPGLMALGLLLLIATPIARVVISVVAFLLQRDLLYVLLTLLVLAILLFSLLSGSAA